MRDVKTRAGDLDEAKIAFDHDDFRHRRHRGQAEPRRDLAFGDFTRAAEARLLGVLDDELVEAARIRQDAPHDERVRDRLDTVGEAERAIRREEAHFGQFAALQPLCRGGVGVQFGEPRLARAPRDELDDRHVIDRRLGVGQRHHRRDAARRGGMARALDRFHVLGAGFTQLHAHIDETRCETQPASVDDLGILGKAGIGKPRADRGDLVAFDQEIARRIEPAVGIDEPSISDEPSRPAHCTPPLRRHGRACPGHPRLPQIVQLKQRRGCPA